MGTQRGRRFAARPRRAATTTALAAACLVLGAALPSPGRGNAPSTSTTTASSALATVNPASSTGPWVIIEGRGFGHGVGMAQDGAYWMGRQGRSSAEILKLFYPGTTLGSRGGNVRVPLGGGGSVRLELPRGGSVGGRPVKAGTTVTVRIDGGELVATLGTNVTESSGSSSSEAPAVALERVAFRTQAPPTAPADATPSTGSPAPALLSGGDNAANTANAANVPNPAIVPNPAEPTVPTSVLPAPPEPAPEATTTTTAAPADTTPSSTAEPATTPTTSTPGTEAATVVRATPMIIEPIDGTTTIYGGHPYRGTFELSLRNGIRVVNELDVEQYLRGMGEVTDPRWPAAALESQAIAARTYAFRTMASAGEVCPTQRCQVYFGARAEYGAMDKAVAATRGKVVTYAKGKLAVTFYSASGGGTIATPEEAFGGSGDFPYLQAGTYPTGDVKAWVVTLGIGELGRRLGYRGSASRVAVTKVGPSGRAVEVTVSGSGPDLRIPGPRFDAALGLRSTFFTVRQAASPNVADAGAEVVTIPPATVAEPGSSASDQFGAGEDRNEVSSLDDPLVFSQSGFFTDVTSTEAGAPVDDTAGALPAEESSTEPRAAPALTPEMPEEIVRQDVGNSGEYALLGALSCVALGIVVSLRRLRARRR